MRVFKSIFYLSVTFFLLSFASDNDAYIKWDKNRKLAWADYTGVPPVNPLPSAISAVGIYSNSKLMGDTVQVEINARFTNAESWVVTEDTTDYLLNHEQRHFDVAEINARKFRKYAMTWDGKYNINMFLSEGSDTYLKGMNDMNDAYDKETNRSLNKTAQAKWNKKIDSLLNVYSAYENPVLKLPKHKN